MYIAQIKLGVSFWKRFSNNSPSRMTYFLCDRNRRDFSVCLGMWGVHNIDITSHAVYTSSRMVAIYHIFGICELRYCERLCVRIRISLKCVFFKLMCPFKVYYTTIEHFTHTLCLKPLFAVPYSMFRCSL